MAKGDTQTQQQTQQSTSAPWAAAQPLLTDLIAKYSGQSTDVTGGQSTALSNLTSATSGIPNFGDIGSEGLSKLFSSSTAPQVGMLTDAYKGLNDNLGSTASGAELNPYTTPGFSDALNTITQNITNATKGVYAGSGRDPSGAGSFAKSLGIGLLQGSAPILESQYNQNKTNQINAANTIYNAGNTTAGAITGQNQVPLSNIAQALGLVPSATGAYTAPGAAQLASANAAYSQPYTNLASLLTPATQLGALGGQTSGSSAGSVTQPQSTLSNIIGGASAGIGLLSFLSDERAKDDIAPIGKLDDGQKVYRFRYKGDPAVQIGLLAQEVAEREPDAVEKHPVGLLMVNYDKATRRAATNYREAA